ncbi:MAG: aminotransferase class I/II-fold pyridoxal phosphate-dependent enzyme, partial [Schleiferiaceae bacterium]
YSRLNNPNLQILEERLALWEKADGAAVFESGMSAISTLFLAYLKPGDALLLSNPVYGGTHHFAHHYLTSIGVEVLHFTEKTDLVQLGDELIADGRAAKIKVIHVETPANPTNALFDLAGLQSLRLRIEKASGSKCVYSVDNTYMGPVWQKPLEFGADVSIYSATKYLSGHSDLIAGAVVGTSEAIQAVKTLRTFIGNMASPFTCWLLSRSVETLAIRMERQTQTAQKVVDFLVDHPAVARVYFPGLASQGERQVALYRAQCAAPGAMISFDVVGGELDAFRVLNALQLVKLAVSLGSNESLAQHPYHMTHADVPDAEKESLNITESTIRFSVGMEHSDDLIADLNQALNQIL